MRTFRTSLSVLITIVLLSTTVTIAGSLPSRSEPPAASSDRPSDLTTVQGFLDRDDVRSVLRNHGLSDADIEYRLAQLSDDDLRYLADNVSQVQAAGAVPEYIWLLLAIFLGVLILSAIF